MNIREELLLKHSQQQHIRIADWLCRNPDQLAAFFHLFMNDEYRLVQRAAGVVNRISDSDPDLLTPYLPQMVDKLSDRSAHNGVRRNLVRVFRNVQVPEHKEGALLNSCFDFLTSASEPVAVKVFSMTVLSNLSRKFPEIKSELRVAIEEGLLRKPSPGYISRAKKVLRELV